MTQPKQKPLILKLVQEPKKDGGYKYDDSHLFGEDRKINRTTMYLSQKSIADKYGGKAPIQVKIEVAR